MNYEPIKNVLLVLLGSAGGFFINKGWFTAEQWASTSGAVATLIGVAWAVWKGRQTGVINAAANLPVVENVTVNKASVAMNTSSAPNVVTSVNAR